MRLTAAIAAIIQIAAGAANAQAAETPPLAQAIVQTASSFCVDILSRKTAVPAPGSKAYILYGLSEGVPQEAMDALNGGGMNLVSRATLASGKAVDGAFVVALGGAAGETCRVIVYKASATETVENQTLERMLAKPAGWRALPTVSESPAAHKHGFFKRDAAGQPYLANILSPVAANPISLVVVVAAIPPNVTLPQGY